MFIWQFVVPGSQLPNAGSVTSAALSSRNTQPLASAQEKGRATRYSRPACETYTKRFGSLSPLPDVLCSAGRLARTSAGTDRRHASGAASDRRILVSTSRARSTLASAHGLTTIGTPGADFRR